MSNENKVVLPEPDAAVKEVMGMATEFALLQAEARETLNELGECDEAAAAYESAKESRDALETKLIALLAGVSAPAAQAVAFQQRVQPWMMDCFGPEISADRIERNHRFLEEALELVQSCGCTASEAHQLVDYVFGRPLGEPVQEAGGVMVTLAALCLANGLDMHECGETELARIWTKVEAIRAKQAAKPKHSPLPMHAPQAQADARDAEQERWMEIGKAIERACIDQPDSTEIVISLERDAGTVTMFDPDGNEHDQFSHEDGFAGVVNAAIEAAIEAAKEQG